MSDRGPRLVNIGGRLYGDAPEPPAHLHDIAADAANAAWQQSNGSIAAYHMLLDEHAGGVINLLSKNPTRLTGPDAPEIAGGDPRLTATGGEVYGGPPGTIQTVAPGTSQAPAPRADQVSPLSESERNMLTDLRGKTEAELTQSEAANLRALEYREQALRNSEPLADTDRDRLAQLRAMPEAELTQPMRDELNGLVARESLAE